MRKYIESQVAREKRLLGIKRLKAAGYKPASQTGWNILTKEQEKIAEGKS